MALATALGALPAYAQRGTSPPPAPGGSAGRNGAPATPAPVTPPPGYVIGVDDQLLIDFWESKEISGPATVLPDGKITLRALGEIQAAGLTLDQLVGSIKKTGVAQKFFNAEPTVTVVVTQINSRFVTITGEVAKPNRYNLRHGMTFLDLIGEAGGLTAYANQKNVTLIRTENGKPKTHRINYKELSEGKKPEQDLLLLPGDRIIVR
jgi:polysaccharide export outer membrane protein